MKDFDGNPITKDSRIPDWAELSLLSRTNPYPSTSAVLGAIEDAKYQALKEYKKNQRQAAKRIPRGGNKFEGKDLSHGNFKNAKINYGKFNGANLEWSDLSDVNFKNANLIDANLSSVDAQDVNLSRANLKGADLSFATLDLADLSGAGLRKANFGSKIITSGPDKGKWDGGRGAHLNSANFNNCHLWNSSFLTSDFGSSDFRRANFHGSDFRASYFKRANFAYAIIDDARGLDKIWKNDKFGSLKFIPHKNQPNTANPKYGKSGGPPKDSWSNPKLWGSRAQLSKWIKDENGNPFLPDHDKAIKAANRLSKTPQLTYLAESDENAHPIYTSRRGWSKAYLDGLIRDGKITTADRWAPSRWPKEVREDFKKAMDKEFGPPLPRWDPPEGSTYGPDPYLCSNCADRDEKEVPADIGIAELNYHHPGTDVVMVKTESGWEMTKPLQEWTIAEIKDEAEGSEMTGYCKDCWIHEYGDDGVVLGKKLFGAEDWQPNEPYAKAVVLIDNSGSTAMEDTGMTDKKTGHQLNRLDRHVLTAATYLGAFPDSGEYRIITPSFSGYPVKKCNVEDFDNTADAIDYLFTLTPSGPGFIFPSDEILILSKDYGNVLLIQDEPFLMRD